MVADIVVTVVTKANLGKMTDNKNDNSSLDLSQFLSYEEYLDSQIKEIDEYYLEDKELARELVQLGYRGSGETLQREEFEAKKRLERDKKTQKTNLPKQLAHTGTDLKNTPFLQALAHREELVRNGKLTTIIFLRDRNHKGQEVSGYIDYYHRLKTEPFEPYFEQKKRLMPRLTDLSYYNWDTQNSTSNSSPNFQVIADNEAGLLFKSKRDRKIINVDPETDPGDNSTRSEIQTSEYEQVIIYDHMTRRKN
eukprot:g6259.t1